MEHKIFGVISIIVAFFFLAVAKNPIFLMGVFYGVISILHSKAKGVVGKIRRPLFTYGLLVFLGGMLMELMAHISNISNIQAGEKVYLFSPNLITDLLIGFPHYVVLGLTWAWIVKRYKISVLQQAVLIALFWGVVVDEFSHFFALLSGNILDFIIPGLLMVFAINWPLVIMQYKLGEAYPNRNDSWRKFPVAFFVQIVPMIILFAIGILLK